MTYIQLYANVKAAFIVRHTSLNQWCITNNVARQNARRALLNIWKGNGAIELRKRIVIDAGLSIDDLMSVSDENVA